MRLKLFLLAGLVLCCLCRVHAQQTPQEALALKIANRMRDTLQLNIAQRDSIYQVNMKLSAQKTAIRQQTQNTDSMQVQIQRVENTRDSLYKSLLGQEIYLLYRSKKKSLVNNNN